MILYITLLVTAFLFGGMTLYSFGFAPYLFSVMSVDEARPLIRKAFPHFYLYVLVTSIAAAIMAGFVDLISMWIMVAIALTVVYARQVLMPAINRATDQGETGKFKKLHGFSVVITLTHIFASGYVLIRLSSV